MRRIKIIVTGRADGSPLRPLIDELMTRDVHVSVPRIAAKDPAEACQQAMACLADRPDIVVLLGDRWETLAAAYAATYARIPIAHIHGGEVTRGSFDNQIRDAITKLSHLHFVATYRAWCRITNNERVSPIYWFGTPGLDRFAKMPPRIPEWKFIVTWHPVTLCPEETVEPLIAALEAFPSFRAIWTNSNNDPSATDTNCTAKVTYSAMTDDEYIAHCRTSTLIIGNSSSGVIEAPYLQVPSVNIGRRQEGREMAKSVFSCACRADDIIAAIGRALKYEGQFDSPYGGPGASRRIADVLTSINLNGSLVK